MKDFLDTRPVGLYDDALSSKNRDYYLDKFEDFDQKGDAWHPSWNWAAFFGGGAWALYRKMYGWFFAWWAVATFVTVFAKVPNDQIHQFLVIGIVVFWLGFTTFANSLYHRKVKARIASVQRSHSDASRVSRRLSTGGGVHAWVPIVFGTIPVIGIVAAVTLPTYLDYTKRQAVAAKPVQATAPDIYQYGVNDKPAPQVDWSQFKPVLGAPSEAESPHLKSDKAILKEQGIGGNQELADVSAWGKAQLSARLFDGSELDKADNFVLMWQRQIVLKSHLKPERALFLAYNIVASFYDQHKAFCRPDMGRNGGIEYLPGEGIKTYPECFVKD